MERLVSEGSGPVGAGARVIRADGLVPTPWPNGRGRTREIHKALDPETGDLAWRLSLATIDSPGPFSVIPQARRTLVLASDTVLRLSIDGDLHALRYTDSVEFDGGAAVEVIGVSGECRALNLMTYGRVGGHLEPVRAEGSLLLSPDDTAAAVVLNGRLRVPDAVLEHHDTLVLGEATTVHATAEDAVLVRVHLATASDEG